MEKEKMINAVELKAGFPRGLFKIVCLYADSADQHSLRVMRSYGICWSWATGTMKSTASGPSADWRKP